MKSFTAKHGSSDWPGPGRNGERDFHGEMRSNATHASTTDPEAKLYRKGPGKGAKLSFMGHALMENRSGLVVAAALTEASGTAERRAASQMIVRHSPGARRITLGANKAFDAALFVADLRTLNVRPTSHRTPPRVGVPPSTPAQPAIPATQRASRRESSSRSRSTGARRSADSRDRCCAATRVQVHPGDGELQSGSLAEADRSSGVTAPRSPSHCGIVQCDVATA